MTKMHRALYKRYYFNAIAKPLLLGYNLLKPVFSPPILQMTPLPYFLRKGLWTLLSLAFILLIVTGVLYIYLESELPDVESLDNVQLQVPLRIYTQDKKLIAEYGEKRRIPVKYDEVPQLLIDAILSTEDRRFFSHPGVDIVGLARAGLKLIKSGRKAQGGSTITMQVARNFFLSRKKTFLRKFNEILLAVKIDSELSKEKILELYLNKIYLGNRAYGVAAAAKVYYGKKLEALSLPEMAMIAGLPQAPSSQNPIRNPHAALKRRNHVLERMYENEKISKQAYLAAIKAPVTAKYHGRTIAVHAPYVAEMIRLSLYKHFNKAAYEKGYRVYTSIDSKLQRAANQALEQAILGYEQRHGYRGPIAHETVSPDTLNQPNVLYKLLRDKPIIEHLIPAIVTEVDNKQIQVFSKSKNFITITWDGLRWARPARKNQSVGPIPKTASDVVAVGDVVYIYQNNDDLKLIQIPEVEGAIISMSPRDGRILALAGGFNFYQSKFNRITQAKRQPGSSIKPFIYAAALAKGFTLASIINDAPVVVDDPSQENLWRPQNDNRTFNGPTRLRVGLMRSRNLVSIRILEAIGIPYAIDYLVRLGFNRDALPKSLSLALGSLHVTPLELTTAYAAIANGGFKVEPHLIDKITNEQGQVILKALPQIACLTSECTKIPTSQRAPQVLEHAVAYLINSALKDVIQNGTGRRAKVLARKDIAGKTGTTNDQRDAWFAGFNTNIVTTTWMGFDNPKSLKEYASNTALPMWIEFMRFALKNTQENSMKMPADLISVRIDPKTGLRTTSQDHSVLELFRKDNLPDEQDEALESASEQVDKPIENLF